MYICMIIHMYTYIYIYIYMCNDRMTDSEKFYFDLNGYIIVRGALSAEEVSPME